MESHLESLITYLSAHPMLALGAVFAGGFLEALAVVGTIIPGSSIVFAGGILIGLKVLDPWPTAACAVVGAVLGDGASYWLGQHYHARIRGLWPLRSYPGLFARGEAYFAKNGGRSVFLGRFLGPIRAIVPIVAGMAKMPARQFYVMNVLSALAWAAAHLLPGVLFGASLQLAGAVSARLVVLVAVIASGLWLVLYVTRLAIHYGSPVVAWLREWAAVRARAGHGRLSRAVLALLDPAQRESGVLLTSAIVLIGASWMFLGIVQDVVSGDPLVAFDRSVYDALQAVRTGWGDNVMVAVTELGSAYVIVPVIAIVALWLALTRRFRTLMYWIAAVAFAALAVLALKFSIGRVRPVAGDVAIDALSFPSGHAAFAMVVYGFLAALLGRGKPAWQKGALAILAAIAILLIAFSRIYLGVHWFSDVAASLTLGIAWISLLTIAYATHVRDRPLRVIPLLSIVVATIAVSGGVAVAHNHPRDMVRYAKPAVTKTIRFDAWRDGGWRSVAGARSELAGRAEEPFRVQWVATSAAIGDVLATAGWRSPDTWASKATLLWLVPSTPIGELPVLPKFHRGEAPTLTFVRPIDAHARTVVRFWRAARVVGEDATGAQSLWVAMITTERADPEVGLIATTRTTGDFETPFDLFAQALRKRHLLSEARDDGGPPVLLVW